MRGRLKPYLVYIIVRFVRRARIFLYFAGKGARELTGIGIKADDRETRDRDGGFDSKEPRTKQAARRGARLIAARLLCHIVDRPQS